MRPTIVRSRCSSSMRSTTSTTRKLRAYSRRRAPWPRASDGLRSAPVAPAFPSSTPTTTLADGGRMSDGWSRIVRAQGEGAVRWRAPCGPTRQTTSCLSPSTPVSTRPASACSSTTWARILILTGLLADMCVLFTAHDAYMRGYRILVPADCVAARRPADRARSLGLMRRALGADTRPSPRIDLEALAKMRSRP